MGIFNTEELKQEKDAKEKVIAWCVQAVSEFYDTAKDIGTRPFTRNSQYSYGPLTQRRNSTKKVHDLSLSLLPMHVVEFYIILLSSKTDNDAINEDFSAAVALIDGGLYFDGHRSTADEIGSVIAKICEYHQELVEELFKSALRGNPWDVLYAREQVYLYDNPHIKIDGDNNIIGGRDVTKM